MEEKSVGKPFKNKFHLFEERGLFMKRFPRFPRGKSSLKMLIKRLFLRSTLA